MKQNLMYGLILIFLWIQGVLLLYGFGMKTIGKGLNRHTRVTLNNAKYLSYRRTYLLHNDTYLRVLVMISKKNLLF